MAGPPRGSPGGQNLLILLATAHATEGDRERLLAASGADGYIEKPIYDPQVLVDKLREITDTQHTRQSSPRPSTRRIDGFSKRHRRDS